MIRPSPDDMMRELAEKCPADLQYTLVESKVALEQQFDLVTLGYCSTRLFVGMGDDRATVRQGLAADLKLDVSAADPAGREARLALAALVGAWEAAKERTTRENQSRADARINGVPRMVDTLERNSMKKAVEILTGRAIPVFEAPSADYLSLKLQEMEDCDPTASALDEISSMADADLSAQVPGWDAAGRSQLFRKRAKGTLPSNPEAFRTKLRIERNLWLYLASKYTARAWLSGMTSTVWEIYTDFFMGKRVLLLEIVHEDGTRQPLNPPWNVVLSYELECRKAALLLVTETGITFTAALENVIKDTEIRELAFTSTVTFLSKHRGKGAGGGGASGSGKGVAKHLADNPLYPAKKNDAPYAKKKGNAKGKKGKGKGKGKGLAFSTPDGRQICFNYNNPEGCTGCDRAHVCRLKGCFGNHPMQNCPTRGASVAAET